MSDPREELRTRLTRHKGKIRKIKINWNASDGGPRTDVCLIGDNDRLLDDWNDWLILGTASDPKAGLYTIDFIIKEILGDNALNKCEVGSFHRHYKIS